MTTIRAASLADIPSIQHMADLTWWPTYSPIISKEQIHYMLDAIYASDPLAEVMNSAAQRFLILADEHGDQGFAAYGPHRDDEPNAFKLYKLYVLPGNHGKGYGKQLIKHVCDTIKHAGGSCLYLNVNRQNPAKSFYEKLGFELVRQEDIPFGPYWMNDFIFRKKIAAGD